MLQSHVNGERTRHHPHYLRSTLYCGICGSRLIVTHARSHTGEVYEYFICAGRHSKRAPTCEFKAITIPAVEDAMQRLYDQIALSQTSRDRTEDHLREQLVALHASTAQEIADLTATKQRLEHQKQKLLEALYSETLSADMLRTEDQRLDRELSQVTARLKAISQDHEGQQRFILEGLDLAEYCGQAYRVASDAMKRMLNQVFFSRVYVVQDDQSGELTCQGVYEHPFDVIFGYSATGPLSSPCGQREGATGANSRRDATTGNSSGRVSSTTLSGGSPFAVGLTTDFLVGLTGFEPATP